jgi:hypothetical protein
MGTVGHPTEVPGVAVPEIRRIPAKGTGGFETHLDRVNRATSGEEWFFRA